MTPEQFARIESLFYQAMMQPSELRAQFLEATESDPEIRALVARLLESEHRGDTNPLSERLAQLLELDASPPPQTVGPYRLLRELGAGGMGTVFLAERKVDGRVQQVALKLLHGLPTEAGKRRMARERSLLAGLNHPNIAGLIDGGETAEGQPWLVMAYVEGIPLPRYLAQTQLPLPQRLRLFIRLCEAVAHAHQRLILHRDLKPSNVLVRADGSPVLLDFGVGKLLEADETGEPHTATQAFTPGYAAPEQQEGQAATTATDVFGLGALLFDLLTDRRLAELRKGMTPVPVPSQHAKARGRRWALHRDLDRIVHKATHENPAKRYPTALALAEDVQRFLQGQPITAIPPAFGYRVCKFVMRHHWAVAAGVIAVIATGLFVWRLEAERQRALTAERSAERAAARAQREAIHTEASRDFLVSVLAETSPEAVRGEPITIAKLLENAVNKLQGSKNQDPQTRAVTWLTIAEVYHRINDPKAGLHAADAALALLRDSIPGADTDLLARALTVRSSVLGQLERHAEARQAAQQVIAIRQRQNADARTMSEAYYFYGLAAMHGGEFAVADRYLRRALTLLKSVKPNVPELHARFLGTLMQTQLLMRDIASADRSFAQLEPLAKRAWRVDHPEWGNVHGVATWLRREQGRHKEALTHAEEGLRFAYRVLGERSRYTVMAENSLAVILLAMGRHREAISHMEQARKLTQDLGHDDVSLAQLDNNLAAMYVGIGDYARGAELANSVLGRLPAKDPAHVRWRIHAHINRGYALRALGQIPQALSDLERALQLAQTQAGEDSIPYAEAQIRYARTLIDAKRWSEAETALATADRAYTSQMGTKHPERINLMQLQALLALGRGDTATAAERITGALTQAEQQSEVSAFKMAHYRLTATKIAMRQRDTVRAGKLLREALPILREQMSPKSPELAEAEQLARRLSL